jgi:hypothetical protein
MTKVAYLGLLVVKVEDIKQRDESIAKKPKDDDNVYFVSRFLSNHI